MVQSGTLKHHIICLDPIRTGDFNIDKLNNIKFELMISLQTN